MSTDIPEQVASRAPNACSCPRCKEADAPFPFKLASRVALVVATWPAVWVTAKGLWHGEPKTEIDLWAVIILSLALLYIAVRAAWLFILEVAGLLPDGTNNKPRVGDADGKVM